MVDGLVREFRDFAEMLRKQILLRHIQQEGVANDFDQRGRAVEWIQLHSFVRGVSQEHQRAQR